MYYTTERGSGESKWAYLTRLVNCFGADNLFVTGNYTKDGIVYFSKWYKVWDLWHMEVEQRDNILRGITHRTILKQELLFDLDDATILKIGDINIKALTIKDKLEWCLKRITKPYSVYFTGSKSYHVSKIVPYLNHLPTNKRIEAKSQILSEFYCDVQKASDKCMIALEGEPHYKSGKIKELIIMP